MSKRKTTKRSDQRRIEQALIRQKPKPDKPQRPEEKPKPQSLGDYLRSLGWTERTSEYPGETITIIGAPRPPREKPNETKGSS
jgi:hypothetical protein